MIECVERIRAYTSAGSEAFFGDRMMQDAVYRNLQILGEAAKKVPDAVRAVAPEIPWRGMSGLRDVIVHQYEGIDAQQVWNVVENELGHIETSLRTLLERMGGAA